MNVLKIAAIAAVACVAPMAAQADVQGSLGTNSMSVIAIDGMGLGSVATLTSGGSVYPSSFSTSGIAIAPAGMTGTAYLATGPGPGAPQPNAVLNFTANVNYVSFLWGSPDTYNTVSIKSSSGVTYKFTATGAAGTTSLGISRTTGDASFSQYVQFLATTPGELIKSMSFTSSVNAFEAADFKAGAVAVPGPIAGAGIPALLALGGVVGLRRRRKSAVA